MNAPMRLDNVRVTVETGTVWITGLDGQDHLLTPRQTMELKGAGWVVGPVGSRDSCRIEIEALEPPPLVPSWARLRTPAPAAG